jgi:hypothetical protein
MGQLGIKPSGAAPGVGEILGGNTRATRLGSFAAATWVTEVGFYGGRNTGATAFASPVFWSEQDGAGNSPGAKVYEAAIFTVSTFMSGSDRTTGTRYSRPVTGLLIPAGMVIYGGIFNDGSASMAYGQDNSGAILYRKAGRPAPDPFNEDLANAQGNMCVWMIGTSNRPPTIPTAVYPTSGAVTVDTTPTIKASFNDPDISLGDGLGFYKIEIWNEGETSRLRTSNYQIATAPMIAAGVAEWTVSPPLVPASYKAIINLYDESGVSSPPLKVPFVVNSGGAFISTVLAPDADLKGLSGTNRITNDTQPAVTAMWNHDSGLSTATVKARIVNVDTGAVYRAEKSAALVVADNATITVDFDDLGTTWSAMARGGTRYAWELAAIDSIGGVTGWSRSEVFIVNATPAVSPVSPANDLSVTSRPLLKVSVADANDGFVGHSVLFRVRPVGGGEVTATVTAQSSGVFQYQATSLMLPALGDYEWKATVTDKWGLVDDTMAWQELHYVAAPSLSSIFPADNSEIGTGTPTITATVDRSITSYQITITRAGTIEEVYDTGIVSGSGTTISHPVPGAILMNNTDFDMTIWVLASDGLTGISLTSFRLEYPAPDMLSDVIGLAVESSVYDLPTSILPGQKPNVRLAWMKPSVSTVSNENWMYYVIYRIGGDHNQVWYIYDRNQTAFEDTTVPAGDSHAYYIGYWSRINSGLDTIESVLAKFVVTVDIKYTTITSEYADDPAVTLHLWTDRNNTFVTDVQTVEILGQSKLDTFHSPLAYNTVDGDFEVIDDKSGENLYTALDIVADMKLIATPVRNDENKLVPRTLYYRDPKGSAFPFVLTAPINFPHYHELYRSAIRMEGIEVSGGDPPVVVVNDEDAVDITT